MYQIFDSFQSRVMQWLLKCFGKQIAQDKIERNYRFIEEALELVQSLGCTKEEVHELIEYTYGRPKGDPHQEVGGVLVTLAALCYANSFSMCDLGEVELVRCDLMIEKIREKQKNKPKKGPLPENVPQV